MQLSSDQKILMAKQMAVAKGLDPTLVCAICEQESNWEPFAIRHEPAFQLKYVVPLHLLDTETIARSISWGLMQCMGEVAREMGYTGPLPMLCDPQTGIEYGCRILAHKLLIANGDVPRALLLYNGGANTQYPSQVLARIVKYR